MTSFSDAHCHFQNHQKPDYVIMNARTNGVGKILCNATCQNDWNAVCGVTKNYDDVWGAIGIHPWKASSATDDWHDDLQRYLVANPKLLVGEIGLDKHHPNMDMQTDICRQQLHMAGQMARGACVHCVGAWDKMLHILKEIRHTLPPVIIFHRFNGNTDIVQRLLCGCNAYFSFANNPNPNILRIIPRNRLLTESDSDNPTDVIKNAQHIANVLNINVNDLICDTEHNITKVLPL